MNYKYLYLLFIIIYSLSVNATEGIDSEKYPLKSIQGFIENKGQIIDQNNNLNPAVLFLFNSNGLNVQLRKSGFSYDVWKLAKGASLASGKKLEQNNHPDIYREPKASSQELTADSLYFHRIDFVFVKANADIKIITENPSSDYTNFYTSGTSEAGINNVRNYQKVLYKNVWNGIDIEFLLSINNQKGSSNFKYNFIIHPNGNVNDIQLKIEGANQTSLSKDGHILIETSNGNIDESIPYSYQLNESNIQQSITSTFNNHYTENHQPSTIYGISVGKFDNTKTLIIDPTPYLLWGSYFGGINLDQSQAIAIDTFGNVLITGFTSSTNAIATSGAYQTTLSGTQDAFVAKFNAYGSRIWATYYGGSGKESGNGITTDPTGNIFIIGTTLSTNNIASTGSYQTSLGGYQDAFIAKFNTSGTKIWSTYYGGNGDENGLRIAHDQSGNMYFTGSTNSATGIATSGAYQTIYGSTSAGYNAFVAKFDNTGSIQWATYFGGNNSDYGGGICIDRNTFVYVTGTANSTTGIATSGVFQTNLKGSSNAFIAKFSLGGSMQWSTYYGSTIFEYGNGITTDKIGNIYIAGRTGSSSGIATSGAFQTSYNGLCGFIAKFNPNSSRIWSTYFGGGGSYDQCSGITNDTSGNIFIVGINGYNTTFASVGAYQATYGGGNSDASIAKFDSSGTRVWSSFYGGTYEDFGNGIAVSIDGKAYITGYTNSTSSIATLNAYQVNLSGSYDGFIAKFGNCTNSYLNATSNSPVCSRNTIQFSVNSNGIFYNWNGPNSFSSNQKNPFINNAATNNAGIYSLLMLDSSNGCLMTTSVDLSIIPTPKVGFTQTSLSHCLNGNNFFLTDTSSIAYGSRQRLWTFNGIPALQAGSDTSTFNTVSRSFLSAGIDTVKLTETSDLGCKDSVTKTLSVYDQTQNGFTINHANQCVQNNFLFTDTSNISNGSYTKLWKFGNGDTSTSSVVNKTFAIGSYTVKFITTTNHGCTDSTQQNVVIYQYPKPVVGFTQNNFSQCLSGNSFLLNDTSNISSGTISRQWIFSDSSTSNSLTLNKQFLKAGNYFIKLFVTSDHNCIDSVSKNVTVFPQPKSGFSQNTFAQCLSGNSFSFNDTSSIDSGNITRSWSFTNLSNSAASIDTSTSSSVSKVFTNAGGFAVKLYELSDHSCIDSTIKIMTVYPQTRTGFTQNNIAQCLSGNNFSLIDTSSISSGTMTRKWFLGDSSFSTNNNLNKTFINAGTYTIKLFETSDHNCIDSAIKTFTVYPQPSAGFTQNTFAHCLTGNTYILNDTSTFSTGSLTRIWNFGDSTISTNSSLNKTYLSAGTFPIKLTITTNNNCHDSLTKLFTVYPQTNIGFTVNNLNQCVNENNYLFTDTSNISSGIFTRTWDFGDGTSSALPIVNRSYNSDGNYKVKLVTSTNLGCIDSVQKTISIYPKPTAHFTVKDSIQCLIENGFLFTDSSIVLNGAYNKYWNLGDSTTNTLSSFNKSYTSPKTYQIQLKVVDSKNCSDSVSHAVIVKQNPEKPTILSASKTEIQASNSLNKYTWFVNNIAIANSNSKQINIHQNGLYKVKLDSTNGCSNISDELCITIINNGDIRIYPNPNNGLFTIDFNTLIGLKTIDVYTLQGKYLAQFSTTENSLMMDLWQIYAKGMYVLKIQVPNDTYYTKVVVE